MCKLILIPDASKILDFDDFSRAMASSLSAMPDGFGFAAVGEMGTFGMRTLKPEMYADDKDCDVPEFCEAIEEWYGEAPSFIRGPAILHGRMSTNSVSLVNTHPIVRDDWHVVHNGVVSHTGEIYDRMTSTDSEHVAYNLANGGIRSVVNNLTGYYAAGAIDPSGLLHIFRDNIATLYYAWSDVLDSPVFATNQDIINDIGEYLNENLHGIKVKDNVYLVYDGNKMIEYERIEPRGYEQVEAKLSEKSLGYKLANYASVNSDDGPTDGYNS